MWRTLTRFTQTDFLTLDFTGIASHVAGLAQRATQGFVVLDQGTGDAVTDRTGLTAYATANDGNEDVELLDGLGQLERLTHDHASGFTTEELIETTVVDGNLASTRTQEDASGSGLTTASAVILSRRHNELSR